MKDLKEVSVHCLIKGDRPPCDVCCLTVHRLGKVEWNDPEKIVFGGGSSDEQ
ncbi:hypothetical protein ACWOBX_01435 [Facklamia languida]